MPCCATYTPEKMPLVRHTACSTLTTIVFPAVGSLTMARIGAAMPPVSDGLVMRLRLHKEEKAQCGAQAKCLENEYSHTETPSIFTAERCVGTQQWGALERESAPYLCQQQLLPTQQQRPPALPLWSYESLINLRSPLLPHRRQ